ncbi:MAG: type I glyceraldehyde-3-phosphate dehydrogenase [Candidatus Babeliales bacterium]|nr:type I glyceraldehyde-3-phosphate dehydrogenase [Candidatus Babeliales bacterium]
MLRIAINGFGRIGKSFLRACLRDSKALEKMQVVAINIGPADINYLAYLFTYDTTMGKYQGDVRLEGDQLIIDNHRIKILAQKDPALLPWADLNIDWVVECTGHYTKRDGALKHLQAGAKKVLISAPAHGEDVTIVPGVNAQLYDAQKHSIVSLGSCTTNAVTPMLKIMNDAFTIQHAMMTTIHAYTNSQVLLDVEGEDERRSRAAALNIIPTTTGAMKVVAKVLPELEGLIEGLALRVPVANVSLVDLTVITKKEVTAQLINQVFMDASKGDLKDIISFSTLPLVSSDFIGDAHSVIIDSELTSTTGKNMSKIFGWYDNEWGYSNRLKDFLKMVG